MMDDAGSPVHALRRASRGSRLFAPRCMVALTLGAWLVTAGAGWAPGSRAVAAEVDAASAPSPVGFADIIERVKPAVVGVRVQVEEVISSGNTQQELPFPPGSPLDRFFRQFGIPIPDSPVPRSETAVGSGFFISGDGYIVTNNHVVANGKSFEVTTDDGKPTRPRSSAQIHRRTLRSSRSARAKIFHT
jgi:serine protease Do